jgi:hypothetical protein
MLVSSKQIKVWSNFSLRYDSGLNHFINFVNNHNFGSIQLFSVSGGARCLATNGIHWLDLYYSLTKSSPLKILGDFKNDAQNPRHRNLAFLSGLLYIRSINDSIFSMVFTNGSYSNEIVEIYWKKFRARIHAGSVVVEGGDFNSELPITRTVDLSEVVFKGSINGDGMKNLFAEFRQSSNSMESLTMSNRILLSSLSQNHIDDFSKFGFTCTEAEHDWKIS